MESKIISTAYLWQYWFQKEIDKQQHMALFILCLGSMVIRSDRNGSIYFEWPLAPVLITIQVCLTSIVNIFTECVYSNYGTARSIHIDNLGIYFWSILSNGLQLFYFYNRDVDVAIDEGIGENYAEFLGNLLNAFSYWEWLLIMLYIIYGLCVAQTMKHFGNIVQLFMNGGSLVVAVCFTKALFGVMHQGICWFGSFLIIVAVLLYKSKTT